jgi:threonine/homoserine/homoserine lactone efflux protein
LAPIEYSQKTELVFFQFENWETDLVLKLFAYLFIAIRLLMAIIVVPICLWTSLSPSSQLSRRQRISNGLIGLALLGALIYIFGEIGR